MRKALALLLPVLFVPQLCAQLPEFYKRVDRLTWVVEDVDKVVAGWRKLGFEQVQDPAEISLDKTWVHGKRQASRVKVAAGRLGSIQVRWIQPVSGWNAYSEFRMKHGSGVFSLVHRVPSRQAMDDEITRLAGLGVRVLEKGEVSSPLGTVSYAYMDTEQEGKYSLGLIFVADAGASEMPPQAPMDLKLSQYAFVVRDPRPVSSYWKKLGFPEMTYTHGELRDLIYRGLKGKFDQELGWQRHGEIVYEWIRPLKGPTVYEEHLKTHGEGFHHLAFDTNDIEGVTARWKELGFLPTQSGGWGEPGNRGSGRFGYVDTSSLGGTSVEFLWNFR